MVRFQSLQNTVISSVGSPPVTGLGTLERLPRDVLVNGILPMVTANGDLAALSQTNHAARTTALDFSFRTVNRFRAAGMRSVQSRRGGPPVLDRYDIQQLEACNGLLDIMLGIRPRLTIQDLIDWEEEECSDLFGGAGEMDDVYRLMDIREAFGPMLEAAKNESATLALVDVGLKSLPKAIKKLTSVRQLDLAGNTFEDLTPVQEMTSLTHLNMSHIDELHSLAGVRELCKLRKLSVSCTFVSDVEALRGHPALQVLDLGKTDVTNLEPLVGIQTLERITIPYNADIPVGLAREGLTIIRAENG